MGSGSSESFERFAVTPAGLQPYRTAKAFETALTARLKPIAKQLGITVTDARRQFAYDRLLARIFGSDDQQDWVLKGGGAMLARDRRARHTLDLDMLNKGHSLEAALSALRAAAARSSNDHLRFEVASVALIAQGNDAPIAGRRIVFDVLCGAAQFTRFHVDLVVDDTTTGTPETRPTAPLVDMPGITSPDVRLYPVTDHIADKVMATMATFGPDKLPSSRSVTWSTSPSSPAPHQ